MRGWLFTLSLFLLTVPLWAQKASPPHCRTEEPFLRLGFDPHLLTLPEVRKHLRSGLTSVVQISVTTWDASGQPLKGGAHISIRFEPWEEVFHVAVLDASQRVEEHVFSGEGELSAWWRVLSLRLLDLRLGRPGQRTPVKVVFELVPFSHQEEAGARAWLRGREANLEQDQSSDQGHAGGDRLINMLVATSIKRKPLLRFHWKVDLEP